MRRRLFQSVVLAFYCLALVGCGDSGGGGVVDKGAPVPPLEKPADKKEKPMKVDKATN